MGGEFGCGDVVVAEGLGDDRGGHFQDVLADGAGPAGGGGDAKVADQRGEGVRSAWVVRRGGRETASGSGG